MTEPLSRPVTKKGTIGRPRKYATSAERMAAYRRRRKAGNWRYDIYISQEAGLRLFKLRRAWKCRPDQVIERLLMQAILPK